MLFLNLLLACVDSDDLSILENRLSPPQVANLLSEVKHIPSQTNATSKPTGGQTSLDLKTTTWDLSKFSTNEVKFQLIQIDEFINDELREQKLTKYDTRCTPSDEFWQICNTVYEGAITYQTAMRISFDITKESETHTCQVQIKKDGALTDPQVDWSPFSYPLTQNQSRGYLMRQMSNEPYIVCTGDINEVEAALLMSQALYAIPSQETKITSRVPSEQK